MIIGQTSSGKSSLTNAILEEFRAEAGLVPTTTEERVYKFSVAEGFDTHIIDTPGIEAAPSELNNALDRLTKADLVIWVMRANQPARSIDQALFDRFESFFEENPQRQRPAVLVAATHIDRIASFADADEEKLAEVTTPLANACRKAVRYDGFCPLALSNPEQGLAGFRTALAEYYERAINTRLNRLRTNKSSLFDSAAKELSSLKAGTMGAVKLMVQNQKGS
jgi:small GTP-binding protein